MYTNNARNRGVVGVKVIFPKNTYSIFAFSIDIFAVVGYNIYRSPLTLGASP